VRGLAGLLLGFAVCAAAFAQDQVRYVTDELAIALRDGPSGEAATRGVLMSGARVQVLERRESSGYARIRMSDGKEAWILERYLTREPIARVRLERAEKELAAAQAELKKLKDENARLLEDFQRISGGEPLASREVIAETQKLREELKQNEQQIAALKARYSVESGQRKTLLTGGGLVLTGAVLALLLRLLWPKRRRGDL
jgi:SH3 domain protein